MRNKQLADGISNHEKNETDEKMIGVGEKKRNEIENKQLPLDFTK